MEESTKNLLKVSGSALLYYWAARRSHMPIRHSGDAGIDKFGAGLDGVSRFLWGYFANDGLRDLGVPKEAALGWTLLGAATIEWYVLTYHTKIVRVPRAALKEADSHQAGWDPWAWDHRHHHHQWDWER